MKRLLFAIGLLFALAACSKTENLQFNDTESSLGMLNTAQERAWQPDVDSVLWRVDSLITAGGGDFREDIIYKGYVIISPPNEGGAVRINDMAGHIVGGAPGSKVKITYDSIPFEMELNDDYYYVKHWETWIVYGDGTRGEYQMDHPGEISFYHQMKAFETKIYKPVLGKKPKPKYQITIISANTNQGTVSGNVEHGVGTLFEVKVNPAQGYVFDRWETTGGSTSSNPTEPFSIMKKNDTEFYVRLTRRIDGACMKAHFKPNTAVASVSVECSEGGYVSGYQGTKYVNEPFTISATPYDGYRFLYWKKNGQIIQNAEAVYTTSVADSNPVTFYAQFEATAQTVNVQFNNFIDNDYYDNRSYIVYQNPQGQEVTLNPNAISNEVEIKKGSSITVHIYISKPGEQIYCILRDSSGEIYYDLSRPDVISQQRTIENITDYMEISLQADSSDFR